MQTAIRVRQRADSRCRFSSRSIGRWRNGVPSSRASTASRRRLASAEALAGSADSIDVAPRAAATKSICEQLLVSLPNGTPLVAADGLSIRGHERILVTGPSGAGKSTLFRAIAGIWPFGSGSIAVPAERHADDAAAAAVFSGRVAEGRDRLSGAGRHAFGSERVRDAADLGGPAATRRGGSRRRRTGTGCCRSANSSALGSRARCCIAPQYLFLDEATASLDEAFGGRALPAA